MDDELERMWGIRGGISAEHNDSVARMLFVRAVDVSLRRKRTDSCGWTQQGLALLLSSAKDDAAFLTPDVSSSVKRTRHSSDLSPFHAYTVSRTVTAKYVFKANYGQLSFSRHL